MTRTERQLRFATRLVLLVALSLFGVNASLTTTEVNGQQDDSAKPKQTPDVMADIDDAIVTLENKDFTRFVDRYAPADILRQLRRENAVAPAVQKLAGQPKFKPQMVKLLKALRKLEPTYDDSHGLATFRYDSMADGFKEFSGELHLPETENLNMEGLGDDLKKALAEGEKLLAQNQIQQFIERIFPASALSRLKEPDQMRALVHQFTVVPEAPKVPRGGRAQKQNSPTVLEVMRDDLKRTQALTPELIDGGQVAIFRIDSGKQAPERAIKFQKVRGHWRFFDGANRISNELTRQAKLKPTSSIVDVQWELIGGNWRFVDFNSLPFER